MENQAIMNASENIHHSAAVVATHYLTNWPMARKPNTTVNNTSNACEQHEPEGEFQGSYRIVHVQNSEEPHAGPSTTNYPHTPKKPSTADSAHTIDTQFFEEIIARVPSGQMSGFALMLAQRMKNQVEAGRLSNQSQTNMRTPSGSSQGIPRGPFSTPMSTATTLQGELSAHVLDGRALAERMLVGAPVRYIVTPHPDLPSLCVKQSVGEPENIPFMSPGIYRQSIGGVMELESPFRSSAMRSNGGEEQHVENAQGGGDHAKSGKGWGWKLGRLFKGKK